MSQAAPLIGHATNVPVPALGADLTAGLVNTGGAEALISATAGIMEVWVNAIQSYAVSAFFRGLGDSGQTTIDVAWLSPGR